MKRIIAIFFAFNFSLMLLCAGSDSTPHVSTSQGGASVSQAQNSQGCQKLLSDLLLKSVLQTHREVLDYLAIKLNDPLRPARILLLGQAGVGKTTIASASAQLLNKPVVFINAATVDLSPTGESRAMHMISECFHKNEPCTVIIDEIDSVPSHAAREIYNFLRALIDLCGPDNHVGLICIANNPELLPDKLRSKLSFQIMSLPDVDARESVLNYHLTTIPGIKNACSVKDVRSIANDSEGLSVRDLENMVQDARQKTYDRKAISSTITATVLRDMLKNMRVIKPAAKNEPSILARIGYGLFRVTEAVLPHIVGPVLGKILGGQSGATNNVPKPAVPFNPVLAYRHTRAKVSILE